MSAQSKTFPHPNPPRVRGRETSGRRANRRPFPRVRGKSLPPKRF